MSAKSMSDGLMRREVAVTHLSRFLALAGYRSRKWIVDSKWHLLHRLYASEMTSLCFLTTVEGGAS